VPAVIVFLAAAVGLVILTLQIAYLPTLYGAFNRRETDVALLNARAGVPSWGPELLARTHYALGTGTSTLDTMPELYTQWERWAADVAESHTTYMQLVRFRSPQPLSSWVTALLAVLDSAALFLALSPAAAPVIPARLCLRAGFECFNRIAQAMGIYIPEEADPQAGISLTYAEFLQAVDRMRAVDFGIERDLAEAWPDFVGWRVNYERSAYTVAAAVYAVPALWSGPRRHPVAPIAPSAPAAAGRPSRTREGPETGVLIVSQYAEHVSDIATAVAGLPLIVVGGRDDDRVKAVGGATGPRRLAGVTAAGRCRRFAVPWRREPPGALRREGGRGAGSGWLPRSVMAWL
jgi:hypothetical protein